MYIVSGSFNNLQKMSFPYKWHMKWKTVSLLAWYCNDSLRSSLSADHPDAMKPSGRQQKKVTLHYHARALFRSSNHKQGSRIGTDWLVLWLSIESQLQCNFECSQYWDVFLFNLLNGITSHDNWLYWWTGRGGVAVRLVNTLSLSLPPNWRKSIHWQPSLSP